MPQDVKIFLIVWAVSTAMTLILFGIWRFLESKTDKENNANNDALFLTFFLIICPALQFLCAFIAVAEITEIISAKHRVSKEALEQAYKEKNALFQCNECKLIQRQHQLTAEGYTHCCGDDYKSTMRIVEDQNIYDYALETGLTPLLSKQEVRSQLKEAQQKKLIAQKKAAIEKTNHEKMARLLEKTAFIEEQNALYLKKEYAKLEKMNAEKEERKEEVLKTLDGEKKTEFLQTIALFDELHEVEVKKLAVLEQNNKEKITALKEKMHA